MIMCQMAFNLRIYAIENRPHWLPNHNQDLNLDGKVSVLHDRKIGLGYRGVSHPRATSGRGPRLIVSILEP